MKKLSRWLFSSAGVCIALAGGAAPADPLEAGFMNPPDSAKPHTWWHWMNGNITKAGITADLEAMKQIGLGGATIVNVDCGIPAGPVPFMSPQWREDFKFAIQEADRLNYKLCVENCAGWSSSGGPWNTPTNAMQRLTSSETKATGPSEYDAVLPHPDVNLGYYRDIAVLAFPAPKPNPLAAGIQSIGAGKPAPTLVIKSAHFESKAGEASGDVTARVAELVKSGHNSITASVGELGGDPAFGEVKQLRVEYTIEGKPGTATVSEHDVLTFPSNAREMVVVQTLAATSANSTFVQAPPSTVELAGEIIPRAGVVDLTGKLGVDGRLRWQVPPGDWVILRLGHTPIGVENHPAPTSGRGLECDKFSQAALDAHWNGFMQKVIDEVGPLAGKSLDASLIDSYEVGNQDWTANFRSEFKKRRGYDLLKFLPTFTGRVVDSPAVTERFLWDMRRTIADLFADNYYAHFATLCREHGLLSAIEPYDGPYESEQCGKPADVVMGEFWTGSQGQPSIKLAASIAHIYGKSIVGAESFTAGADQGRWQNDPYSLKTLGDLMYSQGLNRYYFHRYAMQPWTNRWPGMTMGEYGFHFERTVTWWQQGKSWIDYLSHCEYLLQQGRAVEDAAYFTGQSPPMEIRVGHPALPKGYDFDAVDSDVLLHAATVKHGRITLPSGASYAVLILPPSDANITPPVLERIRALVRAGATVVGPRPQHSPSLTDYPECDATVKRYADEMWGPCDGQTVFENTDGQGHVFWGKPLSEIFASRQLKPDFEYQAPDGDARLVYAHRATEDADIYFVSNQRRQFDSADCTFRVSGKVPELWHADTGVIEPAPVWNAQDGRTTVHLDFDPAGSVFVVFRQAAGGADHLVAVAGGQTSATGRHSDLKIQHAVYTAKDGAGELDVTARLAALAQDGQLVVNVNNDSLGHDPADMHVKELRVDYTLNGQTNHITVAEKETLTLPPTGSIGHGPLWEAVPTSDGTPAVRLWSNGTVALRSAHGSAMQATAENVPAPVEITGAWNLTFPPNWGAPAEVTLEKLMSWTDSDTEGVRYFSGTATYQKDIDIDAARLDSGRELWLDLGAVKNLAEVSLNGQDLGVLWKPPFRVNITAAAKSGSNQLVVKVTNLWPNRLIGDEQLPPDVEWNGNQLKEWPQWLLEGKPSPTGRLTFTTWHHWHKDSTLLPSGLLGPVTLRTAETVKAKS